MKNSILYFSSLLFLATSCVQNETTGEMEPGWLFWVFLGFIIFLLIFGVMSASIRSRKKRSQGDSKTEKEIRNYEKTLHRKENKSENKEDK